MSGGILLLTTSLILLSVGLKWNFIESQEEGHREIAKVKVLWEDWREKFSKQYMEGEESYRFMNFKETLKRIEEHEKQNLTWTRGLNQFSDLSLEEFRAYYGGNSKADTSSLRDSRRTKSPAGERQYKQLTQGNVDWIGAGMTLPPADMGSCQATYAFAAAQTMYSVYLIQTQFNFPFSAQQFVDCMPNTLGNGCSGGSLLEAFTYATTNFITSDALYPYISALGAPGVCAYTGQGHTITGYDYIPYDCDFMANNIQSTPIGVCINYSPDFIDYAGGLYDGSGCEPPSTPLCFQVVQMVFEGYWTLLGTLGATWGNSGYLALSYDDACMVCSHPMQPSA